MSSHQSSQTGGLRISNAARGDIVVYTGLEAMCEVIVTLTRQPLLRS